MNAHDHFLHKYFLATFCCFAISSFINSHFDIHLKRSWTFKALLVGFFFCYPLSCFLFVVVAVFDDSKSSYNEYSHRYWILASNFLSLEFDYYFLRWFKIPSNTWCNTQYKHISYLVVKSSCDHFEQDVHEINLF